MNRREFFNSLQYTDWELPVSVPFPVIDGQSEEFIEYLGDDAAYYQEIYCDPHHVVVDAEQAERINRKWTAWVESYYERDDIKQAYQQALHTREQIGDAVTMLQHTGTVLKMRDGAYLLVGDVLKQLDFVEDGEWENIEEPLYALEDVTGWARLWADE